MFNIDDITSEHNKDHNNKRSDIQDYPYKMLIAEVLDQEKQMHCLI